MRIVVYVDNPCNFDFEIGEFPERILKDDVIKLEHFRDHYRGSTLTLEEISQLDSFEYLSVDVTVWQKDGQGVYMRVLCSIE